MVISGCADGVVAVSNPKSGLVVRVISDHEGAPVTDLQSSVNSLMVCVHLCVRYSPYFMNFSVFHSQKMFT